jgi:hypothetical protein
MGEGNATGGDKAVAPEAGRGGRAFGNVVSIMVNALVLYVAHNLVRWGFLPFVTPAFDGVLRAFDLSIGVTMGMETALLFYEPVWFRHLAKAVTAAVGIVVPAALLTVFPFALSPAWSTVLRVLFVIGIVGSAVGAIVELIRALVGQASQKA